MARRLFKMWVAAVAVATSTACGTAPVQSAQFEATDERPDQEAPNEHAERAEPTGADGQARRATPGGGGDDSGPPCHLLPEDDKPEPVEPPRCELASPTPVAC